MFEESGVSADSFRALTDLSKSLNTTVTNRVTENYDDVIADDVVMNYRRGFLDTTLEFHDVFITQVFDPDHICVRQKKFDEQLKKLKGDMETFWSENFENRFKAKN